jgi:hypothetical protein
MAANQEVSAYIRQAAINRGLNPDVALRVAAAEALNVFDPSKPDLGGDERSSFGPFQLHYKGLSRSMPNAGLGDEFTAATGLHASDPSTWKQQVDFALDQAKKGGWSPWMGAQAAGIGQWQGIKDGAGGATMLASAATPAPASATAPAAPELVVPPPLLPEFTAPHSLLAEDMASSTGRARISGRGESIPFEQASGGGGGEAPILAFASAIPETPPSAPITTPAAPMVDAGLADLFRVKDIGKAAAIDPVTGQPVLPPTQRAIG